MTTSGAMVLEGRPRELGGGFSVRRVLPAAQRRTVGPFIFFDHFGPVALPPGQGLDVRPHPHIALATLTWLFEGEIVHRDSLGYVQAIHPGDVNWMVAGRGIVHSERSRPQARAAGPRMHGIQCWLALPRAAEDAPPSFEHHPARTLPRLDGRGVRAELIAGTFQGAASPVGVASPTLYVHALLEDGATLALPDEHPERAVYVVEGELDCGGQPLRPGVMAILDAGGALALRARAASRIMLLGGAPLDGPRHIWWNFVASDEARIERAKADWRDGRFPKIPGDEQEFIPLPE